jgi:hypothetical protein
MTSLTGLITGEFTDIDVVDTIRINGDSGSNNQVLTSDGTFTSYQDVPPPAVSDILTAGTGIDITATGNPETISTNVKSLVLDGTAVSGAPQTFNPNANGGSQTITIGDNQLNLTEQNGIVITDLGGFNRGIATDIDADTIVFNGTEMEVAKVPNSITFATDGTGSRTGTFDGSSAITIDNRDTDTTYTAGNGIQISGSNQIQTKTDNQTIRDSGGGSGNNLEVIKVPNDLTFTGYATGTYNGSAGLNINLVDTDTTYQGGTGISIDTATNPDTINCSNIPNSALQNSTISGISLGSNLATLTFYDSNGGFITSYNGANPPTSVTLDGDTTYTGGKNITVDTTPNPDEIDLDDDLTGIDSITFTSTSGATALTGNNYPSNPTTATNLDLSSSTNVFPNFVGGSEILKSISYIDNTSQNFNRIYNTSFEYFFSGSQDSGTDTLEIDFTATSTTGYCEFGFYANTLTGGQIFMVGIAAATGGTSPFSTALGSGAVSIDAYKLGLFDGDTTRYSLKEILDFTSFENTYITSNFFFNNLTVGTQYKMALYGRCYNSGSIYINAGGRGTSGTPSRSFHQPAFMKFYEYDSSIGGARTTGSGGGGGI